MKHFRVSIAFTDLQYGHLLSNGVGRPLIWKILDKLEDKRREILLYKFSVVFFAWKGDDVSI